MMLLHVVAGLVGLISGAVALAALKGGTLHKKSGIVFVATMLFLSASGALLAVLQPNRGTVVVGLLTFYMVMTAFLTVRRPVRGSRFIDAGAMLAALVLGIAAVTLGFGALNSPTGKRDGYPATLYFIFGSVAMLATLGDARLILGRGLEGAHRVARHLWRMCLALFVAALSFFVGRPRIFPQSLRSGPWLMIPELVVLAVMFYWLARVLFTSWYSRTGSSPERHPPHGARPRWRLVLAGAIIVPAAILLGVGIFGFVQRARDGRKSIAAALSATIASSGIDRAAEQYRALRAAEPTAYRFDEGELNVLGYRLIHANKVKEAIRILQLNVEAYPQSSNVYDSLGEAYMEDGNSPLAIANYRKSLELDPSNSGAVEALHKLDAP